MNRQERLKKVYEHLRKCGMVHTQKAFAESLGKAEGTMSKAFKGDEKALTDNLFLQVTVAFPNVFDINWMLTGEGEMLIKQKTEAVQPIDHSSLVNALLASKDETIEAQRRELDKSDKLIKSLSQQVADLRARVYALENETSLQRIIQKQIVSERSEDDRPHL